METECQRCATSRRNLKRKKLGQAFWVCDGGLKLKFHELAINSTHASPDSGTDRIRSQTHQSHQESGPPIVHNSAWGWSFTPEQGDNFSSHTGVSIDASRGMLLRRVLRLRRALQLLDSIHARTHNALLLSYYSDCNTHDDPKKLKKLVKKKRGQRVRFELLKRRARRVVACHNSHHDDAARSSDGSATAWQPLRTFDTHKEICQTSATAQNRCCQRRQLAAACRCCSWRVLATCPRAQQM